MLEPYGCQINYHVPKYSQNGQQYLVDLTSRSKIADAKICNFQTVQITNGNGKFSGLLEIEH